MCIRDSLCVLRTDQGNSAAAKQGDRGAGKSRLRAQQPYGQEPVDHSRRAVSYTHLDVYKRQVSKGVLLPLGEKAPALQRLNAIGLSLMPTDDSVDIMGVKFGSRAAKLGIEQGFKITALEVAADWPDKEWLFIPAFVLLALIVFIQRRRVQLSTEPSKIWRSV